jgi:uncharacterized SAM-binding protein YcdF (DUF218 family)
MDVILELGGNIARMDTALQQAKKCPSAKLIVSSEGSPDAIMQKVNNANLSWDRVLLDYNAWDTVTNFTKTLGLVRSYRPIRLYVVTDEFHMKRAMAIANAVYFLRGIKVVPVPHPSDKKNEPASLVRQDRFRAWLWRLTGFLKYWPDVLEQRWPGIVADQKLAEARGYPLTTQHSPV